MLHRLYPINFRTRRMNNKNSPRFLARRTTFISFVITITDFSFLSRNSHSARSRLSVMFRDIARVASLIRLVELRDRSGAAFEFGTAIVARYRELSIPVDRARLRFSRSAPTGGRWRTFARYGFAKR